MTWMPQYQIYYGVHLDDHTEVWAGRTYNKLLVLDYPDANLNCTATTEACGSLNIDFLYPLLVQSKFYLDGVADGQITYKCGAAAKTCTGYIVGLYKLSADSIETPLGSMCYMFPTTKSLTANQYLTVPVYLALNKQAVNENEKLLLRTMLVSTETSGINLSHANDTSVNDIKIRLPYAPTG